MIHEKAFLELDWLKRWSKYTPQKTAIKDGETGREFSYEKFYGLSAVGATVLSEVYGITKGDRVAVLAPNELEYVVLFFALQRLGAILVPVNHRLTQREVNHIFTDCEPKLVLYDEAFKPLVDELPKELEVKALLLVPSKIETPKNQQASFGGLIQQDRYARQENFAATADDAAMIIYTSGTTGAPKGAVLSHNMIFWNSINTTMRLNISQNDCAVIFLPFFHTGAWNVLTTPFLHRGAKIVFTKKFDPDLVLDLTEKEQATLIFGVPTTMDMMARSPNFKTVDLSNVRYAVVGGEPMPLPLIETWHSNGVPIRQGYGLTEFGPNVFSLSEEDAVRRIGSIGFPNFYVDTKIVDDKGNELGSRKIGELLLKGPMCMTGYWKNEKATKETITDGWLHTGDLAYQDDEGYFYIAGRKKEMFKSGGENVYPIELEQVLCRFPGIKEVAVVGVPDVKWGEAGKAFVVLENEIDLNNFAVDELRDFCEENLAKFKIPKYFEFVESLPKGDSGKVLKRKLLEL